METADSLHELHDFLSLQTHCWTVLLAGSQAVLHFYRE